jgi:hypothetical protein
VALREPPCSVAYKTASFPLAHDHQSAATGTMVAIDGELPCRLFSKPPNPPGMSPSI